MLELNNELSRLAQLLPSTEAGIEALDLVSRAIDNVTNERFKRDTIKYIKTNFTEYVKKASGRFEPSHYNPESY